GCAVHVGPPCPIAGGPPPPEVTVGRAAGPATPRGSGRGIPRSGGGRVPGSSTRRPRVRWTGDVDPGTGPARRARPRAPGRPGARARAPRPPGTRAGGARLGRRLPGLALRVHAERRDAVARAAARPGRDLGPAGGGPVRVLGLAADRA